MPKVVETIEREDGHKIAIYESGAQYDLTAGRLVAAPKHAQFTPETSMQAVERRLELKREAVARGAARVLEQTGDWEAPNDMDVIEAISEAVMLKALNPKDAKQVDAARYLENCMGLSESQTSSNVDASNNAPVAEALRQLAAILDRALSDRRETVDAEATDLPAITDTRNE